MRIRCVMPLFAAWLLALTLSALAEECVRTPVEPSAEHKFEPITKFDAVRARADELAKTHGAENVLVVFDIDNTLLAMKSGLGSDQWFNWQSCLISKKPHDEQIVVQGFDRLLAAQRMLFSVAEMRLTSRAMRDLLNHLRQKDVPTLLLTSRGPQMRNVTRRQLENNEIKIWEGFDARKRFLPDRPGIYMPYDCAAIRASGLMPEEIPKFQLCKKGKPRPVSFMGGIYMTAGLHKGAMLRSLLATANRWFPAIIFVDDHMKHIVGMDAAFRGMIGEDDLRLFHFVGELPRVTKFNESEADRDRATEDWRKLTAATCEAFGTWCSDDVSMQHKGAQ